LGFGCLAFSPFLGAVCIGSPVLQFHWRNRRFALTPPTNPEHWIFAILSVWLVLGACIAPQPGDALLGLANFLPYFGIFVALRAFLTTPEQLRQLAGILVLTALPINLIGLGQLYGGWAGPIHLGLLIDWTLHPTGNPAGRMSSVFHYANVLANYLVMIWPFAIGLTVAAYQHVRAKPPAERHLRPSKFAWMNKSNLEFGILSLNLVLTATSLILTDSRNAWAIAALVVLVYALYWGWRWLLAATGLMVACVAGAAFGPPSVQAPLRAIVPVFIWARLNDQLYPDRPIEQLRTSQWDFAWSMALQHPWTGWGLRSFASLYKAETGLGLGHPHNLYLMLAAETGLVTTTLFIGLVGWMVWRAVQQLASLPWHSPHQIIGVMYITAFLSTALFHLLDIPLFDLRINLLGWLLLAGLAAFRRIPGS
jgi:O-antigen ligase